MLSAKNAHSADLEEIQHLARVAARDIDPGSLQSLLLRRIGFPFKQDRKLYGRDRYVVIVQITEDTVRANGKNGDALSADASKWNAKGKLMARWFYAEWAGQPGSKDDRIIVATGRFNTVSSVGDHRVNIESVALGKVEPIPDAANSDMLERIVFTGAARVSGHAGVTFRSEVLDERRFFSLASPFSGDGRANCSVFISPIPQKQDASAAAAAAL